MQLPRAAHKGDVLDDLTEAVFHFIDCILPRVAYLNLAQASTSGRKCCA